MLNKLIQQFNLQLVWEIDGAYVYNNENLLINFIELHSGTDWKYCLRADFPETFDRWSVALFDEDFKIDEFGVATKTIKGGEEELVEFVADKVGSFEYYCSIGTHRAMGMWGTLRIE